MAYISRFTGEEIDNSIIINENQNNKLNSIETDLLNIGNTVTNVINTELQPIKNNINTIQNDINTIKNNINSLDTEIETSINGLKFKTLTKAAYDALSSKDSNTLYIIIG